MRFQVGDRNPGRGQGDPGARGGGGLQAHLALVGDAGQQSAMQPEHLARAAGRRGVDLHGDVEIMGLQDLGRIFAADGGGNTAGTKMDAVAGRARTARQDDGVFEIGGMKQPVRPKGQDIAVLDADHPLHRVMRAIWQADGQRHAVVAGRREIVDDLQALRRGAVAESPFIDRPLWQGALVRQAQAGVEHPRLQRAAVIRRHLEQRRHLTGRRQELARQGRAGPQQVHHAARPRQDVMQPVLRGQRRGDEDIGIIARRIGVLILDEGVLADRPAGLPGPAGDAARHIAGDHDMQRILADIDLGDLDRAVGAIEDGAIAVQHGVVLDDHAIGIGHGDAVGLAVDDDIVLDRDVAVIHLAAGQTLTDHLVAQKDRLGPGAVAHVQHIAADHHIGRGGGGAGGPELDHVGMVA